MTPLLERFKTLDRVRGQILGLTVQEGAEPAQLIVEFLARAQQANPFDRSQVHLLTKNGKLVIAAEWPVRDLGGHLDPLPVLTMTDLLGPGQPDDYHSVKVLTGEDVSRVDRLLNGDTRSARKLVAIPMNGSSKTFGVLLLRDTGESGTDIEAEDSLCIGWFMATTLAGLITLQRARNETYVTAEASTKLLKIDFDAQVPDRQHFFGEILELFVRRLQEYVAGMLHLLDASGETLVPVSRCADEGISWDQWRDEPIPRGTRLAGLTLEKGEPIHVVNAPSQPELFSNWEWIESQGIRSCVCYPVFAGTHVIGTVTLYKGYEYQFSPHDDALMSIVAAAIGSYLDRERSARSRRLAEADIVQMRADYDTGMKRQVAIARQTALKQVASELHTYKNVLVKIGNWVRELEQMNLVSDRTDLKKKIQEQVRQILPDVEQKLLSKDIRETFSPAERVRTLMRSWRFEVRSGEINVDLQLQPELSIFMSADTFDEIVYNLVSNAMRSLAVHRTKEKSIEIRSSLVAEGASSYYSLEVRDNGTGIRNEDRERIFEEGFTTFRDKGGTGMGLFLVRNLVREYGGKIHVGGSWGQGAAFDVRIPYSRIRP